MSWADWENDKIIHVTHIGREQPAIATLTRQRDDLTAHVARLEAENVALRRRVARLEAVAAAQPRKVPAWWIPLAWLGIAWGAADNAYAYEPKEGDR